MSFNRIFGNSVFFYFAEFSVVLPVFFIDSFNNNICFNITFDCRLANLLHSCTIYVTFKAHLEMQTAKLYWVAMQR